MQKKINILIKITNSKNIKHLFEKINKIRKISNLEFNYKKLNLNLHKDINIVVKKTDPKRLSNCPVEITKKDLKKMLLKEFKI